MTTAGSVQGEAAQHWHHQLSLPQSGSLFGRSGSDEREAAVAAAAAAAAAAELVGTASVVPLSSAECERKEHAEPEYAAFTAATCLLLTLLQLAL